MTAFQLVTEHLRTVASLISMLKIDKEFVEIHKLRSLFGQIPGFYNPDETRCAARHFGVRFLLGPSVPTGSWRQSAARGTNAGAFVPARYRRAALDSRGRGQYQG